ncbi:alpha-2-macroglobulin [Asinibacterium sp. OR53]|uniref:alpha-2-macroglobulin family protein n=1 Tax=Asinibacterium sp. OR53 TaxID=925409 RepID=UPI0004788329|nr:alpha-2-macroglobulin family protein [Asinibacterium sp. OR53]
MALKKMGMIMAMMLCIGFVHAQQKDTAYQKEWKEIDSLIVIKSLPKSALVKLDALQKKVSQQQQAQVIKCLIYRYSLQDQLSENDPSRAVQTLLASIDNTDNTVQKSILKALVAKKLYEYFNRYRWRFYNRKATVHYAKADISTWGIADFHKAITQYFLEALADKEILLHTSLKDFEAILIKGNRHCSSLYHLLANEALVYFKSGDPYSNDPLYVSRISDPVALSGRDAFIRHPFLAKDNSKLELIALQLYQHLLTVTTNADELVETDIERIEWVYGHAQFNNKESAYRSALETIISNNKQVSSIAKAWIDLAQLELQKAGNYQASVDTSNRYAYVKAKKIIDNALSSIDKNNPWRNDFQPLLSLIAAKELSSQTEQVNIPGKPFRALVSFRNIDTVYARIIRIDTKELPNQYWEDGYWKKITSLETYRAFSQALPVTNDYRQHAVEIKIDGLAVGRYALLCSNSPLFNDSLNKLSVQFFSVSNISYVRNDRDFFVLNRENGQPLANVNVAIFSEQRLIDNKQTDRNGYFMYRETNNRSRNTRYVFSKGKDELRLDATEFIPYQNDLSIDDVQDTEADDFENGNSRIFFFTDRSIYRPGQYVYFKGIAVKKNRQTRMSRLITRKDSGWVYLYNVNGKRVDSVHFSLNDYGSFSGRFQVPQNTLTGIFSIQTNWKIYSSAAVSVEAYKRPRFFAGFDKVKGSYRLNDSVTVHGNATAYAGNSINGAKVSYTVKRNTRYLNPWLRGNYIPMQSPSIEIAHGEVTTDDHGKFNIPFKALADDHANREANPVFNFEVSVSITDINGETRTASTIVKVGYASIILQANIPDVLPTDSFAQLKLSATNLDGQPEQVKVHVSIYPLEAPQQPVRKRYWQNPDLFVMSRDEFTRYFPNDEYENESNYRTWKAGAVVTSSTIDTKESGTWQLTPGILHSGYYKIESVATDAYGQEVKDIKYIQLFSITKGPYTTASYQFSYTIKGMALPGDTARFYAASMADQVYVIRRTDRPGKAGRAYSFNTRNKGFETIAFTTTEADRGGVGIAEVFVYNNRVYTSQYNVLVPWTNKQLTVSYASFRNHTEPGSKEQWTVQVKGEKGQQQAAELLTGMYDASLDQFKPHGWNIPAIWETNYWRNGFIASTNFSAATANQNYLAVPDVEFIEHTYDHLPVNANEFWSRYSIKWENDSTASISVQLHPSPEMLNEVVTVGAAGRNKISYADYSRTDNSSLSVNANGDTIVNNKKIEPQKIRTDFNETAFFFPQLYADSLGNYGFSFTMPEALTTWKWMTLAHTKDLAFGAATQSIITQKTLMVQPNLPRFLREGDQVELSSKIANLGAQELTGQATLELIDATTGTPVDGWFQNVFPLQYFTAEPGKSTIVKFPIQVPFSFNKPLTWRIVAKAGNYSDGEENTLPVVTNRILVTESLPLFLQKDTTQSFRFEKLLYTSSETLTHEGLTVEYTTNPTWYAVKALPYLIEYPYECAEQTFNRVYANALAAYILQKNPKIKQVLDQWITDTSAAQSNLQKNQALKQLLIEETPWVFDAENEASQSKNLALLLDLAKLDQQTDQFIEKLQQLQLPSGGFAWFKGGYEDRYMTNYILTGIGKLKRLGAFNAGMASRLNPIIGNAIKWLDNKMQEDYQSIHQNKTTGHKQWQLSSEQIQYLYMRSFFKDIAQTAPEAYRYFYNAGKQHWNDQNQYNQAMLGLAFYRNNDVQFVNTTLLPSILENTVENTAQGSLHWKSQQTCFWYTSPIEHQSIMISFLQELQQDNKSKSLLSAINKARTWLLLNKQTNNWKTTVATADACYALLQSGSGWLNTESKLSIRLGNYTINNNTGKQQAGTGYFNTHIDGKSVKPEMGAVTVQIASTRSYNEQPPSWGSVYWQYFENLDKITAAATPLSLSRKLFVERNTENGKALDPVKEGEELKLGDKVVVRIELKSDRDMEYLHLKDMRAAAMEPVNVLSAYKWQDGLGYYESTRDASTNFFISYLRKGTYVFEYPTFVTQTGVFSVGIATIQCMYAPEFNSHSEGFNIRVGK